MESRQDSLVPARAQSVEGSFVVLSFLSSLRADPQRNSEAIEYLQVSSRVLNDAVDLVGVFTADDWSKDALEAI